MQTMKEIAEEEKKQFRRQKPAVEKGWASRPPYFPCSWFVGTNLMTTYQFFFLLAYFLHEIH